MYPSVKFTYFKISEVYAQTSNVKGNSQRPDKPAFIAPLFLLLFIIWTYRDRAAENFTVDKYRWQQINNSSQN